MAAPGASTVAASSLELDELKTLWSTARACRDRVRRNHPDAADVPFADLVFTPGRWEQGLVHVVVCNRQGDWVIADLQNSGHPEYQAIKPRSARQHELATQRASR